MEIMLEKLSKIVDQIILHRDIVSAHEKVVPSVTIDTDDGQAISLKPIQSHNTFNSVGMKKLVILRYGIDKSFAESMLNSYEIAENFVRTIEKSVFETLNKLTNNNIRLTEQITLKYPEQDYNIAFLENGNFELRVYCRILL